MWVWRALIFGLSIALFAAVSSPACASDNLAQITEKNHYSVSLEQSDFSHFDNINVNDNEKPLPNKTPAYQLRSNPNLSLPPFERQAASAFGSTVQNEPIFVLAFEFLPEVLGLKHFLAPLNTNNALPWYLRPDAAHSHGRLAGWKDGNSLYTGSITYLS